MNTSSFFSPLRNAGLSFCALLLAGPLLAANPSAIPLDQLGATAQKQYSGDGLSVFATSGGARLTCVFQKMEGEATPDGLWLTSTVTNALNDRFRIIAAALGREPVVGDEVTSSISSAGICPAPLNERIGKLRSTATLAGSMELLARTGTVSVAGQTVRFTRPGLIEEYSISMDGVRQDFVVRERPEGAGALRVELDVTGAKPQSATRGAQLVLPRSGRKIAYSRLRVTDAAGKELPARTEVASNSALPTPHSPWPCWWTTPTQSIPSALTRPLAMRTGSAWVVCPAQTALSTRW
jgi:hypothetical protein